MHATPKSSHRARGGRVTLIASIRRPSDISLSTNSKSRVAAPIKVFGSERENNMTASSETAILAGGCFWGMQDLLRRYPGVISTRVGYTGGDVPNATYRNHGTHAEAIEIVFDPQKTTYRKLLEFFFQIHDPTTLNRQGNDRGTSYRSAIFYTSEGTEADRDRHHCRCECLGSLARQGGCRSSSGWSVLGG